MLLLAYIHIYFKKIKLFVQILNMKPKQLTTDSKFVIIITITIRPKIHIFSIQNILKQMFKDSLDNSILHIGNY